MTWRFLDGVAWFIKKVGLAHALDHSPSGECNCKSCVRTNPHPRESFSAAFQRGLEGR